MQCHGVDCDCKGLGIPTIQLMEKLEALREKLDRPIHVTSGYRCPAYNAQVSSSGGRGPHTMGKAVDIACFGETAFKLVDLALNVGFTGIGIKQHGKYIGRFIHLDFLTKEEGYPRPAFWSYP